MKWNLFVVILTIALPTTLGCDDDDLSVLRSDGGLALDGSLADGAHRVGDGGTVTTPDGSIARGDVTLPIGDASTGSSDGAAPVIDASSQGRNDAGENPEWHFCGDGRLRDDLRVGEQGFEECDDGNQRDGDGCDSNCQIEGLPPLDCVEVQGRDRRTIFCRGRRSFSSAKRACRLLAAFTGTIVTVVGAGDNQTLANVLRRNQEGSGWIGLNDRVLEGILVWDGRDSQFRQFGGRGLRNDEGTDCGFLRLDNENWQIGDCADAKPFICEEHPI